MVCLSRSASQLDGEDPWQALSLWFERFIAYLATKRALADELLKYMDKSAPLFTACRASMYAAGEPLLKRAQDAGEVRSDVEFGEILQMVMGIGKIPTADPAQTDHSRRRLAPAYSFLSDSAYLCRVCGLQLASGKGNVRFD